jgi:hypothetical protein
LNEPRRRLPKIPISFVTAAPAVNTWWYNSGIEPLTVWRASGPRYEHHTLAHIFVVGFALANGMLAEFQMRRNLLSWNKANPFPYLLFRIPTISAMHSNAKSAACSDLKSAGTARLSLMAPLSGM